MKTQLISRISYKQVFKEETKIETLLNNINILQSLEILAIINKYEYKINFKSDSELVFILHHWITNSNIELKKKITKCYYNLVDSTSILNKDFSSVKIINHFATLRCIEILLFHLKSTENKKIDAIENNENLLKLYLLVNDEIGERQDLVFKKWYDENLNEFNEVRLHLFMGLTHVQTSNNYFSQHFIPEILKFIEFEKWLRENQSYTKMVTEYFKSMGLSGWNDYFKKVYDINKAAIDHHKITFEDTSYNSLLTFFSEREEINYEWNELKNLQKRPILKIKEEYLILDLVFLLNKFFSGIYHDLIEISQNTYKNNFHQEYNTKFIEKHLLINSIKAVFKNSHIQFAEENIKSFKIKNINNISLPDYYIRNGNKLFLFECKNSFLSIKNKKDLDFELIEKEIKEKFYETGDKKKAVKQLINFILNSETGKYSFFDEKKKDKNAKYFPILITTDHTLNFIGFNKLLNEYFNTELNKLEYDLKKRIYPLTIIHIDDLLNYNELIKKLDIFILDYHRFTSNTKNRFDVMISFSDYLKHFKLKDKELLRKKSIEHILKDSIILK
ncbi:hypothetical protein FUA48_10095 [Flavobacterium alkalisoli]|uniref:Uncharacterized protein n=1 Tax=Flavobacterium alkalisoli TaxID=2602769 RepID=A0A5B9FYT6_9FLAO|nr:hypothetical protein [Flavobacterium alkalisoli]QEE49917.1 hypothetical protein FUA48_10095 [Flavobacterium alkalisoli]